MSQQPFSAADLRGAVDLSGLAPRQGAGQAPSAGSAGGAAGGQGGPGAHGSVGASGGSADATVVAADLDSFSQVVNNSVSVPAVLVLWSPDLQGAQEFAAMMERLALAYEGRFRLATANVKAHPQMLQAFQIPELPEPMTIAVLQGQPMPLFGGVQPEEQVRSVLDQVLQAAVQYGLTGRANPGVSGSVTDDAATDPDAQQDEQDEQESATNPHHERAYAAIEDGNFDAALDAYDAALAEDPQDTEAQLGRQQVVLLQRAGSLDPAQVRERAAADPKDVQAQLDAADIEVLGGHVEDAFGRLIDTVRATADEERDAVRARLLELFDLVGSGDPRVRSARSRLMSALF